MASAAASVMIFFIRSSGAKGSSTRRSRMVIRRRGRPRLIKISSLYCNKSAFKREPATSTTPSQSSARTPGCSVGLFHGAVSKGLQCTPSKGVTPGACIGSGQQAAGLSSPKVDHTLSEPGTGANSQNDFQGKIPKPKGSQCTPSEGVTSADRHIARDQAFSGGSAGRALENGAATRLRPSVFDR